MVERLEHGVPTPAVDRAERRRIPAFDYLRSFGVLLVLVHHAALAFVTFAFLNPWDPMQTFSPVVNGARWAGFDRIVLVNDTFFMPLLFLVSGLFVWQGLERSGMLRFLWGRLKRLGIPFVVGVVLITPLAYYPTALEIHLVYKEGLQGLGSFWLDFFRGGLNPPGPLWFIWLLLAFDIFVALVYGVVKAIGVRLTRNTNPVLDNPLIFVGVLFALSLAAYIPLASAFGPDTWKGLGPFRLQISRGLIYLLYFLAGVALGVRGLTKGAFREGGPVSRYWWAWVLAGAASYAGLTWAFTEYPTSAWVRYVFLAEMALMVMALTAVFVRFAGRGNRVLDNLSRNSYGIYLLHYLVIIWLQYAVLRVDLPVGAKFGFVFCVGLALCWSATAALRRIPLVRKVI
jgi:peptidoglycan/LPS O-acetylase OafA/YrhL